MRSMVSDPFEIQGDPSSGETPVESSEAFESEAMLQVNRPGLGRNSW